MADERDTEYLEELELLNKLEQVAKKAYDSDELIVKNMYARIPEPSFMEKLSDKTVLLFGSWNFVLGAVLFSGAWMLWNRTTGFDPYPFILLNLGMSTLAMIQNPIILMAQNRSEEKDRHRDEAEYVVNMRAEMEMKDIGEKLDIALKLLQNQRKDVKEVKGRVVKPKNAKKKKNK